MLARQMVVLSFDILCTAECDILDDVQFERLLRICASGIVAYGATSPCAKNAVVSSFEDSVTAGWPSGTHSR